MPQAFFIVPTDSQADFIRQKIAEELRKTVITSPIDGVILNLQAKLGDVIEPKGDILVIGDPTQ
ncbi:hypothetical protein PN442_10185, partial [Dolichospermum circinale CS-547]|nr:hypothetical protein [Dolichospermum circinale CS-547]